MDRRVRWGVVLALVLALVAAFAPSALAGPPAALVYRAEAGPGPTGPLDGATSREKVRIGLDGVDGVTSVRYEARGPAGASAEVTAPAAPFEAVLDLARAAPGRWTLTAHVATAAGERAVVATVTVADERGDGGMPPITVSGDRIERGGQPWWFAGYNSFVWSGNCGTGDEKMTAQQVDAWFASMRHDGHGAVRLFFFDGWDTGRLDAAVASARRNDVYLTITLDDAIAGCGTSRKDASWFSNSGATGTYERHLRDLVTRYRGEPAIAWFEYFNEPTDAGGALRGFYDRMGAVAKGIDPTRLFSSGTIAPYATGGDAGYRRIHESPGVDIASLHEYDENEVVSNHGPGARTNAAGKPVIVGEFGIKSGSGCGTGFASRARRFDAKVRAYVQQGYAGALAWAWQPGGGSGCEYGNIDADTATQTVLRTVNPSP